MAAPLSVNLFHGSWQRDEEGHWSFQRKPNDLGYSVLVKPTETIEGLETLIRDRYNMNSGKPLVMPYQLPDWMLEPDGTRRPPITLTTTAEVEAMMSLRSWYAQLRLCVTSGPEDVAHHQFLNKTTFSIGGATFVFKGYGDEELVASKAILEEIFNEQELVSIYRAHLELEKAKEDLRDANDAANVNQNGGNNEASGSEAGGSNPGA